PDVETEHLPGAVEPLMQTVQFGAQHFAGGIGSVRSVLTEQRRILRELEQFPGTERGDHPAKRTLQTVELAARRFRFVAETLQLRLSVLVIDDDIDGYVSAFTRCHSCAPKWGGKGKKEGSPAGQPNRRVLWLPL